MCFRSVVISLAVLWAAVSPTAQALDYKIGVVDPENKPYVLP